MMIYGIKKCYMVEKIYHKNICVYHIIELWDNSAPSVGIKSSLDGESRCQLLKIIAGSNILLQLFLSLIQNATDKF